MSNQIQDFSPEAVVKAAANLQWSARYPGPRFGPMGTPEDYTIDNLPDKIRIALLDELRAGLQRPGTPLQESISAMQRQVGGGHYKGMKIQHFTFCMENQIPWAESAAIKYICRHQQKNKKEDLLKAIHYLEMAVEHYYPDRPASYDDARIQGKL